MAGQAQSATGWTRTEAALNGIERGGVAEIQRARLLAAAGQVICEQGAARVTVAHVVERAGVSRRTFYEIFTGSQDCLLATLQEALERTGERILPAWRSAGSWRERVRGSLLELLALFDEEPILARLLVVESLAASGALLQRRTQVLAALIDAIDEGRKHGGRPCGGDSRLTAEGVLGGVLAVLHARISDPGSRMGEPGSRMGEPGSGRLLDLVNPLTSMIVLPYLGGAAARRELKRTLPAAPTSSPRQSGPPHSDPFKDAGMRLTYRTVRVLTAIAEHPNASNRLIGTAAGMRDQGQISKLLSRLERIGLVSNSGVGPGQGAPNAWTLTQAGREVAQRLHAPVTEVEAFRTTKERASDE